MINLLKSLYLPTRFFFLFGVIVVLFCFSFLLERLFLISQILLALSSAIVFIDGLFLFGKGMQLTASRKHQDVLSLGDNNTITLHLENHGILTLRLEIIDELPYQLQERNFKISTVLKPNEKQDVNYQIRPNSRGEYVFGKINVFVSTGLGLISRRDVFGEDSSVKVFPSIIQMKKFEFVSVANISHFGGIKRIRKIGHSYEYEQIKEYVSGDDTRIINWKASGRTGKLMVNQYEDEKSQQIYCILDKSRSMRMPFNNLSLLDYAINSTLVISNIVLRKHDKIGLISFSDKLGSLVKADSKRSQLNGIFKSLYNEKENKNEADYELLYNVVRNVIHVRSLLFLFTNFESMNALERVLPILRRLNKQHLLVVVFFNNIEIQKLVHEKTNTVDDIYQQTIARKMMAEKQLIYQELRKHNIQTIVTNPDELSISTINKYLELKSRGLI
jgi:uncharacterized protein (DUF58 family)